MFNLLKPIEVDELLRYGAGRARRLALCGKIPHIILPNGEMRFDRSDIEKMIHDGRQGTLKKSGESEGGE
jgi:predicted site-specific integrase-resolvase